MSTDDLNVTASALFSFNTMNSSHLLINHNLHCPSRATHWVQLRTRHIYLLKPAIWASLWVIELRSSPHDMRSRSHPTLCDTQYTPCWLYRPARCASPSRGERERWGGGGARPPGVLAAAWKSASFSYLRDLKGTKSFCILMYTLHIVCLH